MWTEERAAFCVFFWAWRALMRWWKKVAGLATRMAGLACGGDGIARSLIDCLGVGVLL
jgi:hypothetical protein